MATLRIYLERDADLPPNDMADLYHPDRLMVAGMILAQYSGQDQVTLEPNVKLRKGRIWIMPATGNERRRIVCGSRDGNTILDVADVIDDVAQDLAQRYPRFIEVVS